jgi:hypothetical protein
VVLLSACSHSSADGPGDDDLTAADLRAIPAQVRVNGRLVDVESNYLPQVVMCENPDAPNESLKAQAIAARTFLVYRTRGQRTPSIGDGQSDQVYTCDRNRNGRWVSAEVAAAVSATRGMVIAHGDRVISGFFVAGAHRDPACRRGSDPTHTERFITLNNNRSGAQVAGSSIGDPSNPDNRGCMGQFLANCLADEHGLTAVQLLKYFYGADIVVRGAADDSVWTELADDGASLDPGAVDSGMDTTCPSATLGTSIGVAICVQSKFDCEWYQCAPNGHWANPVVDGVGPIGACGDVIGFDGCS